MSKSASDAFERVYPRVVLGLLLPKGALRTAYDVRMVAKPHRSSSVLASGERQNINRIAATHGARNVRVFGSVGRGESSDSSDLDLLVEMSEGRSLFDLVALGADLEEALGVAVDVVTEKSLSPYLRDRVLAEAVSL